MQTLTHTHTHTGKPGAAVGDRVVTRGRSGGLPEMLSISLSHNTPLPPEQPSVAQGGSLYLSANKQPEIRSLNDHIQKHGVASSFIKKAPSSARSSIVVLTTSLCSLGK